MTKLTLKAPLSLEAQARLSKLVNPELAKPPLHKQHDSGTLCASKPGQPAALKVTPEPEKALLETRVNCEAIPEAQKADQEKSREKLEEAKSWLQKTFPKAFDFQDPKPLKAGIHHDMPDLEAPVSRTQRARAIRAYVCSPGYLKAVANGQWRYDLNGEPVEKIRPEQRDHAEKKLLSKTWLLGKKNA
eukprot:TRINITY_DN463_c1_g5_i1.p4 TRINITY_DN463_c1_g5~~TRINITY_DN463_c1_g5_i1.p4  ORF type:complete len:188 (+),score=9.15 TRINITY_DN463_c1_g5_i1:4754-5317(+)